MKYFSLAILFCFFSTVPVGNSVTIKCYYYLDHGYWPAHNREYQCHVLSIEVFTEDRVNIEKAEGNHRSEKSDDDVKTFTIIRSNLTYFPRNVENIFKNLERFHIYDSNLIEITSEDLRPFPKLKSFYLDGNPIEIIRESLFVHNSELEILYLVNNKINHIDPNALNHLNKLNAIWFNKNTCKIDKNKAESRPEVLEMVKQIEQGQCQSPKSTTTTENPLILEINQLKQQIEQQ
ncbi:hypothetical protein PVAND_009167 [Polypedilum vanderplanki]|uniref:Uncharacterized protein n=1 Tax=Polypedilum vanderplanki TaxID=319348 RepID=A0A9J6CCA0_POLVA|nr:hypothetical protein PVAND_009167 [Polypedilum vanderplanki]